MTSVQRRRVGPLTDRQWLLVGAGGVLAVLVLAMVATVGVRLTRADAHEVTAPLPTGRDAGTLVVTGGVNELTLRTADLGSTMYRITTPPGSGAVPHATTNHGAVSVRIAGSGGGAATVALSSRLRWDLRLAGGLSRATLDLSNGSVSGVDFASGLDTVDLKLPRPSGRVPVRVGAGANQLTVHLPAGVPAQVRVRSGAGSLTLDGATHNGVAGGTAYPLAGYPRPDAYQIDLVTGISSLVVRRD
ncbi:MAG TPA: hypothetical protein VJT31_08325 [Rugosimonospora sp.]|nr:hypothetical protein [Rugosimonospora sp.]